MDNSQMLPEKFLQLLPNLTEREQTYFRIMWAKYGVLYITAKPGVAKSAIARSIADKMGFRYMDLRLSMVDETDVGLFPSITEIVSENGETSKCLDHVVPRWALESNKQPTIIHFEELNRASQAVRNAALQILLERQIGINFAFNDTVLLMASGNLGDEDGTDVEEFDSALNNRLIHYKHVLTPTEWLTNFAEKNVHKTITAYIKVHPEQLYKTSDSTQAYATPRSWTMLSEFITKNYGKDADPRVFLPLLTQVAPSYIGNSAMKYIQYCQDMLNININDVLNDFDRVKEDLKKYNRDKNSELIQSLKELDLNKLGDKQVANAAKFLKTVGDDELTAYLLFILDNNLDITKPKIKAFMLEFEQVLRTIKKINKPGGTK
jgi:hypothetical protein